MKSIKDLFGNPVINHSPHLKYWHFDFPAHKATQAFVYFALFGIIFAMAITGLRICNENITKRSAKIIQSASLICSG